MDRERVPAPARRDRGHGHGRKGGGKRPRGPQVKARDGVWHVVGTIRVGRRSIRLRRSTGLPAVGERRDDAEALRDRWCEEIRNQVIHGVKPTKALGVAARDYLKRPRSRPLNGFDVKVVQALVKRFGPDPLDAIPDDDWNALVNQRHAGNKPQTRERWLNVVFGFLKWCMKPTRGYLGRLPAIERMTPAELAANSTAHQRRRVVELRPDLVMLLIDNTAWHVRPQLAVEWSTGARVSSVVNGCRLCDVILAVGREQISFQATKNGKTTTASLHPWAAEQIRLYLARRGRLHDREGPLFLTHAGQPYSRKGLAVAWGGKNKTAYNSGRSRAIKALLRRSVLARREAALVNSEERRGL
jgi:integrase